MTTAPIISLDDYQQALLKLLPRGRVWNKDLSSNMAQVMAALAPSFKRLNDRAINVISDAFVGTTNELLPEWEETLGLPDPCQGPNATAANRRKQAVARFVGTGGLSIPAITAFAQNLGYPIQIREYAPFFADRGTADSAVWDESAAYLWTVIAPQQIITYFSADLSVAGDPLVSYQSTVLQCELARVAPAHTQVGFAFTLPTTTLSTPLRIGFGAFTALPPDVAPAIQFGFFLEPADWQLGAVVPRQRSRHRGAARAACRYRGGQRRRGDLCRSGQRSAGAVHFHF
jgi:uncharacterized protein YmfQ (DUF2313 family)